MALDVGRVRAGELDHRVGDGVHRRLVALAQPARDVLGEVDAEALERSVVIGAVRVVHGRDQRGVAAVDAPAVVDQPAFDRPLVEEPLEVLVHRASLPAAS